MKSILFLIVTVFSEVKITPYSCDENDDMSRGSLYLIEDGEVTTVQYGGWDAKSIIRGTFMIHAWNYIRESEDDNEKMLECRIAAKREKDFIKVTGGFKIENKGESFSLTISCST